MKKIIHIFDLDGTLMYGPNFVDFLRIDKNGFVDVGANYVDYFKKIKSSFWDKLSKNISFKKDEKCVVIVDADSHKPFSETTLLTYFPERKWKRFFKIKNSKMILDAPSDFYMDPLTLENEVNSELRGTYNKVENKMIITGRHEEMRKFIRSRLKSLNFDYPNFGLYLYGCECSIKDYKTKIIIDNIKKYDWQEIHLYEDRGDWLDYIGENVKKQYPDIKFVGHLITNK